MPNIPFTVTTQNVARFKAAILSTGFVQGDLETDADFIKRFVIMFAVTTVYNYEGKQALKSVSPDNTLIT